MANKQRDDYITELKSYINDGEINVTDNLNDTIYIIDDLKISGDFMDGVRGVDHNVLLTENAEWKDILQWGTVIVPESKTYISDKPIQTLDDLGLDKVPLNNNHKEPIQESNDTPNLNLYHGSKNNFNEFEIPNYHTNGGTLGFGTYLTDSIERANSYADTNGYLYTVELTDELSQSQPLNATKVTLTINQVAEIIEKIAEKQIKDEEYPYILSDWEEPTSETTIDAGNKAIINRIAQSIIDDTDDLNIINGINNQLGGNNSGADTLVPILNDVGIHYAVLDVEYYDNSKEYVVFNPKDLKIVDKQQPLLAKFQNQDNSLRADEQTFIGEVNGSSISLSNIEYYSTDLLDTIDPKELSNNTLSAVAVNLLDQAKSTYKELLTMSDDDDDKAYWQNDYDTERNSYRILANELKKRGIDVPDDLDYFDNTDSMYATKEKLFENVTKITEANLKNIAEKQLIVKADDPVQAVQKLYNHDLESAIKDSFTLSDVSEKEAQHFLKTVKWEDIVNMENSHDALKYHGNGLYSDEYIKPNSYNPYQENTKILNNDKQQGLSQQYKNLNKQINSNPDNNQHLKTQLTEVREKISQQTQQELKDYQKQNVDLKKPTQDSRQSLSR